MHDSEVCMSSYIQALSYLLNHIHIDSKVCMLCSFYKGPANKSWQKKISVCAAQVTKESDTKETMPAVWILPTESFKCETFQHNTDLLFKTYTISGWNIGQVVFLLFPLCFNYNKTKCETMVVRSFSDEPCTSGQPSLRISECDVGCGFVIYQRGLRI